MRSIKSQVFRWPILTLMIVGLAAPAFGQVRRSSQRPSDVSEDRVQMDRTKLRFSNIRKIERIIGGGPAGPSAYPWAAALVFPIQGINIQYCGGSLISKRWILTAAHCDVSLSDKVILGRDDLRLPGGEILGVADFIPHRRFDSDTLDFDIALVKLSTSSDQEIVSLIEAGSDLESPPTKATVIGWGVTSPGAPDTSPILQEVQIPILKNTKCKELYKEAGEEITENMICAAFSEGEKDSCQGDSGGPMQVRRSDESPWHQAGIVSWGIGCADKNHPGVYTRVSEFLGWIQTTMNENK